MTGAQLIAALNQGADSNPAGYGGFPRPSGFTYRFTPTAPVGQRTSEVRLTDGTPIDPTGTYSLAVTNYVVGGGDGVTAFKDAQVLVSAEQGTTDVNALIAYARSHASIDPLPMGVTLG